MLWDSNAPMQLLKTMPKKLSPKNLEKIQMVIDADKYKNSLVNGFDLCGIYAPFCENCNKTSIYPCALAYVKMMQLEGMDISIDAQPIVPEKKKYQKKDEDTIAHEPKIAEPKAEETLKETEANEAAAKPEKVEDKKDAVEPIQEPVEEVKATPIEEPIKKEIVKETEPVQETIEEVKAIPIEPIKEEVIEEEEPETVNGEQLQIETVAVEPIEEKPKKVMKIRIAMARKKHVKYN